MDHYLELHAFLDVSPETTNRSRVYVVTYDVAAVVCIRQRRQLELIWFHGAAISGSTQPLRTPVPAMAVSKQALRNERNCAAVDGRVEVTGKQHM